MLHLTPVDMRRRPAEKKREFSDLDTKTWNTWIEIGKSTGQQQWIVSGAGIRMHVMVLSFHKNQ